MRSKGHLQRGKDVMRSKVSSGEVWICHAAVLLLGILGGCHEVTGLDPSSGRPIGSESPEVADAGPDDAYVSPRRDAVADLADADLADAPVGSPTDAGDGGILNEAACNACEEASCRDVDGLDLYAACFLDMQPAIAGPGAGTPRSELCLAVLHCARVTGCAATDPQPCFCGEGVSDIQCLAGNAAGPCKGAIEIAAETTSSALIAERLADPVYASGAAFNLLRYCEAPICGAVCTGGGGSLPDAGPTPPDAAVTPPPVDAAVPAPDAAPSPCADLDQDGTPDCEETLVLDSRFDGGASSWPAEFGATASFDASRDALGGSSSGALAVTNTTVVAAAGTTMAGASQCVPVVAGATYAVATQILLTPGQGAGAAGVSLQFFPAAGCTGAIGGAWATNLVSAIGTWTTVSGSVVVPAGTGSLRVRLVVQKPFTAPAFRAHFDNVLLEKP